jgi:Fe2+ transport system protein FeoA
MTAPSFPNASRDAATTIAALPDLAPDELARVLAVDADSDDAVRLKSLGICVGRRVQLAKGGDPLIVRVLGTRVGLSARLARCVRVESLSARAVNPP